MLSKLLTVLLVLTFVGVFGYTNIAGASGIVQSGLVSCWSFDAGTVVGDTVRDVINVNDGTIVGDIEPAQGKFGQGLRNTGMTNYIQVGSDGLLGATSITVWAMADEFSATHYVFGHTTLPAWKDRIQIYSDNGDGLLDLGLGDSHARHTDIAQLEAGQWHHIGLVYTDTPDGDYQVYVDGELKAEGSFTGLNELMGFADIANDGSETGRDEGWLGVVDEFCLYDRALSADEVRQNYQAEGVTAVSPSGKLSAVWGKVKTGY